VFVIPDNDIRTFSNIEEIVNIGADDVMSMIDGGDLSTSIVAPVMCVEKAPGSTAEWLGSLREQ